MKLVLRLMNSHIHDERSCIFAKLRQPAAMLQDIMLFLTSYKFST